MPIQPIAFFTFSFSSPSWYCVCCPCRVFLDSLFLVSDTWQSGVVRRQNSTIPPPPTPPPPLNLYKKSYVARGDNRWICSCHPTWPHERQRTIKLRSKGKAKAQGAVYVSKMLRPTFPYQRYLAPFMMVNRPARGLQLKKNKQTIKHLAQITGPQKALTKESAGAGLNGPTQRKETAKWRKNWKDA